MQMKSRKFVHRLKTAVCSQLIIEASLSSRGTRGFCAVINNSPPKAPSHSRTQQQKPGNTPIKSTVPTYSKEFFKNKLKEHRDSKRLDLLAITVQQAREQNIPLDASDYLAALLAHANPASGSKVYLDGHSMSWLYEKLKKLNIVNNEVYIAMAKLYGRYRKTSALLEMYEDYQQKGFALSEKFLLEMINAMCDSDAEKYASSYFNTYRTNVENNGWKKLPAEVYLNLSGMFCLNSQPSRAVQILRNLTQDGVKFPVGSIAATNLIDIALLTYDFALLMEITNLYSDEDIETLPIGLINKISEIGCAHGHDGLITFATNAKLKRAGQLTANDISRIIVTHCRNENIIGTVETAMIAQRAGIDMYSLDGEYVQSSIARLLKFAGDIDKLYYALIDALQGSQAPSIVLNGLVESTGRANQLDRGFATFQEYVPVFQVQPDIHAYNALLAAMFRSKQPVVKHLLTILKQMENEGITANKASYSYLLEAMINCNEVADARALLEHMNNEHIEHSLRTLRRLAICYQKNKQEEDCKWVLSLIESITGRTLPNFLTARIANIQNKQNQQTTLSAAGTSGRA